MQEPTKRCSRCSTTKPESAFYCRKDRAVVSSACRNCLKAAQRRPPIEARPCEYCGVEFTPGNRAGRYCSVRCNQMAWRRAHGVGPVRGQVVDGKKQCVRCHTWKSVDEFGRRKDRNMAVHSKCKLCASGLMRDYSQGERGRNQRYARKYGVSIEWYEAKLVEQGSVCAICGRPPDMGNRMHPRLAIDHCHETGVARGLLCFLCNSAIGRFADDPILLLRAHAYLKAAN